MIIARSEMRIGRRIPRLFVDAVQYAAHAIRAGAQQALEAHAEFRRLDLARIAWRDSCDAVGELQAGLQETDRAVIFDAVDIERARRQAQRLQQFLGELPLEGDVVDA